MKERNTEKRQTKRYKEKQDGIQKERTTETTK